MPRVRNKITGLVWDVPEGHYSLSDPNHEVLQDEPPPPVEAPVSWRLNPQGGGWYEILRGDEVVDKVRGAEDAEDRLLELRGE